MRVRAFALAAAIVLGPGAAAISPPVAVPMPPGSDVPAAALEEHSSAPGDTLVLRGLDKVTAETRDFEVGVGEEARFGSLTIAAHYCRKRPPEETPEVYALVEVFDRTTDGSGVETEPERIFSGWMFASSPALNPLEHPVYDVWPLDCKTRNAAAPETRSPSE